MKELAAALEHGHTQSADQHKAELRNIKKKGGNALALASYLMHNANLFNIRVLRLVARTAWSEQTAWGRDKLTTRMEMQHAVALSTGSGDQLLLHMWRDVTENGPELAKLGLAVLPGVSASDLGPEFDPWSGMEEPGVTPEQAPPRIMNLLMSFWE